MSKIHIILSPSQQEHNKCVVCGSEKLHCREIAKAMYKKLCQDNKLTVTIIPDFSIYEDYLKRTVKYSNELTEKVNAEQTIHFSIHTDAYNSTSSGTSVFYFSKSSKGKTLATTVYNNLVKLTKKGRSLTARDELAEIRGTKATAILTEIDFHDNPVTAKFIHDNINKIADNLCLSIYESLEIKDNENRWKEILKEKTLDGDRWIDGFHKVMELSRQYPELQVFKYTPDLIEKLCGR